MPDLLLNLVIFFTGFLFLTAGAEFLVRGAGRLAVRLSIPPVVIGLTVVAFGTSLPELLVSVVANLEGGAAADLAIGNVVGSNIANLALILGTVALLAQVSVERSLLRREYPLMFVVFLAFYFMALDGVISRPEGILLFAGLLAFTLVSYRTGRTAPDQDSIESAVVDTAGQETPGTVVWNGGLVVMGIGGLLLGAHWLVDSAQFIARYFGVSELAIGLTLVALGTSLPELATSIVAIRRHESDLLLGNLVGSNLFNVLAIAGITAMVKPLSTSPAAVTVHMPIMIGVALLTWLLALSRPHAIVRWKGALLLGIYLVYNLWLFTAGASGVAPGQM